MQALGYAAIFAGVLLLTAGVKGSSLTGVARGEPDAKNVRTTAAGAVPSAGAPSQAGGGPLAPSPAAAASAALHPHGGRSLDQATFGAALSKFTGLDKGVVARWLLAEQPPGQSATPGSNNWLNVQYTDSGPNSEYWRIARLSPVSAARATAEWMARNQPGILRSARGSATEQERAITGSGWASSHYGGHL